MKGCFLERLSGILITVALAVTFFLPFISYANQVTLTWNKPDDSRVTGYNIYCGISGTGYTSAPVEKVNSPDLTSCLILNLEEGQLYDFTATSFDSEGNESEFSEIITYLIAVTASDIDGDGYAETNGDCDDNDILIHPGAIEICGDGIDQDCNGSDLICIPDPADIDDDGDGYTENQGDCNDINSLIHPGAIEICGDGIDQDCNGSDLICIPDPADVDDEGDGYAENHGDCNDINPSTYPDSVEICVNGIDQNFDGINDADDYGYGNKQEDQSSTDVQGSEPFPHAPMANAGPDQVIDEGEMVTLNGSNSNDLDNDIVYYKWEQISGVLINLHDSSAVQTTFKSPDVNTAGESLSFKLIVTDSLGQTSEDTCIINVTWNNESPVADAGVDKSVDQGSTVILDGSESYDSDDGIKAYLWDQKSGMPVVLSDPSSAITSFTAPFVQNSSVKVSFQLTVWDSQGLRGSDEVGIIISDIITSGSSKKDGNSDSGCFINVLFE